MGFIYLSLLTLHLLPLALCSKAPPLVKIHSLEDQGDVQAEGVEQYIARDLGFSGKIGTTIINVYGDTFHANYTSYPGGRYGGDLVGFVANSAAIGDPTTATRVTQRQSATHVDTNNGKNFQYTMPDQFCAFTEDEQPSPNWGLGLTAVQDVDGLSGVLYTLKLYRGDGRLQIRGAGIAKVDNILPSFPTCTRLGQKSWRGLDQPWYGTYGTLTTHILDQGLSQYIYAYGQANETRYGNHLYLARVPRLQAYDISAYRYWNGKIWQTEPLTDPQPSQAVRAETKPGGRLAAMPNSGQGSFFYSAYHKCYILLEGLSSPFNFFAPDNYIQMRTAYHPEGPWSAPVVIAKPGQKVNGEKDGESIVLPTGMYAPSAMPYYDPSGKTLQFTFTYAATVQRLLKLTFA